MGAAIRFAGLGGQSFWVDETVTANLLAKPLPGLLAALPRSESTPPLYYVLGWGWCRLFGSGEAGLRSLSAVAGTVTIPVAYAAGATLVSRRAGLLVAALATVSPLLVWYSQEARAYALFVLLGALSLLAFAHAYREPAGRWLAAWAASSALALLTHYFAVFLILGEAALLLHRSRRRTAWAAVGAVAAVGLALAPLAAYQARFGSSSWIRSLSLGTRFAETLGQLLVPSEPSIWAGAGAPEGAGGRWPVALVLTAAAVAAAWLAAPSERRGARVGLALGAGVVCVPAALSVASHALLHGKGDVFLYRNAIVAWLPLSIAVAAALTSRRAGPLGLLLAAVLLAGSAGQLAVNAATAHLRRDDWRLVAREVGRSRAAVVLSPSWEQAALEYYRPDLRPPSGRAPIGEIDVVSRRWTPSYSKRVTGLTPPAGFTEARAETLQNWTLTVFRAQEARAVSAGELSRVRPPDASWASLATP